MCNVESNKVCTQMNVKHSHGMVLELFTGKLCKDINSNFSLYVLGLFLIRRDGVLLSGKQAQGLQPHCLV